MEQLSLFIDEHEKPPSWEDVQKGRAVVVHCGSYSQPCKPECMWTDTIGDFGGVSNCCYLFRKPIIDGRCPASYSLEWTE